MPAVVDGFDTAHREVARIVLTASGGPFRGRSSADLAAVTVDEALAHPTWSMGPKITIDSSTLMNKGLEVIEAHELFGVATTTSTSWCTRNRWCIRWPSSPTAARSPSSACPTCGSRSGTPSATRTGSRTPFGRIDWSTLSRLDFEPPDLATFRCLPLAYEAGRAGGAAPAWLSAANEVAVEAFLEGLITWSRIADVCVAVLDEYDGAVPGTVEDVIAADATARRLAASVWNDERRLN